VSRRGLWEGRERLLAPRFGGPTRGEYTQPIGVRKGPKILPGRAWAYAWPMRTTGLIVGVLAILAGAAWTLQGVGILPGSFMSSNPTWVVIGLVTVAVGIGLVAWSRRRATSGT